MGLKNRMSLTQALGLLRCRHQAIRVKDIKYYQIQRMKITDTIYPFNAKKIILVVVLRPNRGSDFVLDISKELNTSGVYRNQSRDIYMLTQGTTLTMLYLDLLLQ
jgi:hypothetical protein